jgi:hypothetical protein
VKRAAAEAIAARDTVGTIGGGFLVRYGAILPLQRKFISAIWGMAK